MPFALASDVGHKTMTKDLIRKKAHKLYLHYTIFVYAEYRILFGRTILTISINMTNWGCSQHSPKRTVGHPNMCDRLEKRPLFLRPVVHLLDDGRFIHRLLDICFFSTFICSSGDYLFDRRTWFKSVYVFHCIRKSLEVTKINCAHFIHCTKLIRSKFRVF